ncbi:MAG TPA: energy transducer TonB [Thermoanaerobaculaceae bacterium]|nr:energy transducer TonB [Thermoanaerobaculaceae bacterium]HRS15717.1 energy transducer TonB [Thermoanaerobaculaceae bacterium]
MIDPVSAELESRARERLSWRWAAASALVVHVGAGLALLLGSSHRPRALSLPSVQVRIAPGLPAPSGPAAAPARASGPPAAPERPPAAAEKPAAAPPAPARRAVAVGTPARPARATPRPATPAPGPAASPGAAAGAGAGGAGTASGTPGPGGGGASGGVALGAGSGTEESFPFAYYLNRVLGTIESNWFKPPVPPDTRSRVRCRIDRSGRVVEAGIEEASGIPAFDRAALRAVYASAPFPPLPLGFAGASLTLHLEFGP